MGSLKLRSNGFARILELVLVLILLFALVSTITQQLTPPTSSPENLEVLSRYASDIKNMVCNSERDREWILAGTNLTDIQEDVEYSAPPDLNFKLAVLNASDGSVINSTSPSPPSGVSVMTSSCPVIKGSTHRKLEVQTWY